MHGVFVGDGTISYFLVRGSMSRFTGGAGVEGPAVDDAVSCIPWLTHGLDLHTYRSQVEAKTSVLAHIPAASGKSSRDMPKWRQASNGSEIDIRG